MSTEVAFGDLEAGKYYKLRDPYQLTVEQHGYGTLQEDIDTIASSYYKLEEDPEDGDARFRLPPGESIIVPYVNGVNQPTGPRNYIFISSEALPDGEDTLFLEDVQENIPVPANPNGNSMNNGNPMNSLINLTNSSGGRRKRRQSKKRKTLKRKHRKQTRKARKSRHRV